MEWRNFPATNHNLIDLIEVEVKLPFEQASPEIQQRAIAWCEKAIATDYSERTLALLPQNRPLAKRFRDLRLMLPEFRLRQLAGHFRRFGDIDIDLGRSDG